MDRLALLPVLALLTACATTPLPDRSGPAEADLAGTVWRFVEIDGAAPASPRAQLRFEAGRLSATVGCNGIGGDWTIDRGRIAGGPYVSTKMFCEGLMKQEAALAALLAEKPEADVAGKRLTLRGEAHSAVLVRAE